MKVLVTQLYPTLWDPMDYSLQAPLSMEFSRQEYWSRWLYPFPGDLPDPGIKTGSPTLQADALPSEPPIYIPINSFPWSYQHVISYLSENGHSTGMK